MDKAIQGTCEGIGFEGTIYHEARTYDHPGCTEVDITSAWIEDEEDFSMYDHQTINLESDEKDLICFLDNKHEEIIEDL